ncbi:MAG: hypothetical protein HZC10_06310 [Nitrospirae bacterium]|nr:hypothetical protein [Nitrospirota bacterium]
MNENIIFVAGSHAEKRDNISPADGIYRTLDGGENWTLVKQTPYLRGKEGIHFAFDKGSSNENQTRVIYAGTHMDGLLKSSDGGTTWKYLGLKGIRIFDVKINPKAPSRLIVATQDGFYVIEDGGNRIGKLYSKGLPRIDLPITSIGLDESNPNVIYAAARKAGVYRSDDGGKTFYQINKELAKDIDYNQVSVCSSDSRYIYVSLDRHGGLNPLWSNDGGKTLNKPFTLDAKERSLIKGRFFSAPIAIHPKNCQVALTSANGADRIIKTTDGGKTWNYSNSGYRGGRMGIGKSSLTFSKNSKKMIFFLIDFGPALTVDGGETFQMLDIPRLGAKTTPVGAASPGSDIIVTAIGEWGKQTLAFSNDGGKKWKVIPGTEDNYKLIVFHPQKPDIIYAQGLISKDNGITWKKLSEKIYAVFRGNGNIVYSISEIGKNKSIIKRSNDQGETWKTPYPELPIEMKAINEIDVDPLNPDRIYIASNAGFYIFDGKRWIKKDEESGLSKDYFGLISFKCVAVDPMHPEVVYTGRWAPGKGHSNGIFRSTDYGKTWQNISYNLGDITIWSVSVSPHDGTVYIGSSHGTWKLPPPY